MLLQNLESSLAASTVRVPILLAYRLLAFAHRYGEARHPGPILSDGPSDGELKPPPSSLGLLSSSQLSFEHRMHSRQVEKEVAQQQFLADGCCNPDVVRLFVPLASHVRILNQDCSEDSWAHALIAIVHFGQQRQSSRTPWNVDALIALAAGSPSAPLEAVAAALHLCIVVLCVDATKFPPEPRHDLEQVFGSRASAPVYLLRHLCPATLHSPLTAKHVVVDGVVVVDRFQQLSLHELRANCVSQSIHVFKDAKAYHLMSLLRAAEGLASHDLFVEMVDTQHTSSSVRDSENVAPDLPDGSWSCHAARPLIKLAPHARIHAVPGDGSCFFHSVLWMAHGSLQRLDGAGLWNMAAMREACEST